MGKSLVLLVLVLFSFFSAIRFENRLSYVTQVLVSRKFNNALTLELAPSFFDENTVRDVFDANGNMLIPNPQDNSQFAIGMGGRYKITKRWSVNMNYAAHLNRASESVYRNPLSIGMDLETGGHVFQMYFTNSRAMHETGYLGQTAGRWEDGEICFGLLSTLFLNSTKIKKALQYRAFLFVYKIIFLRIYRRISGFRYFQLR